MTEIQMIETRNQDASMLVAPGFLAGRLRLRLPHALETGRYNEDFPGRRTPSPRFKATCSIFEISDMRFVSDFVLRISNFCPRESRAITLLAVFCSFQSLRR
jgi:hypothetical protein